MKDVSTNSMRGQCIRILAFNDSCSLEMIKGETVEKFDEKVSYTITEDRKNGIRTTQLKTFDMLLNEIRYLLPTTYALVRGVSSVPCMHITAATQARN